MERKAIVSLIAIAAVVAVAIIAGCVGDETPAPATTPTLTAIPRSEPALYTTGEATYDKIEGLTAIRVGGGIWANWDADMENDGPVVEITYLGANGDTITGKSTKKLPISADVKIYAKSGSSNSNTKLVFSAHYSEDQIIIGGIRPEIRIPKEELSVNPSKEYWCGDVEVTISTPKQGTFAAKSDFIELYENEKFVDDY